MGSSAPRVRRHDPDEEYASASCNRMMSPSRTPDITHWRMRSGVAPSSQSLPHRAQSTRSHPNLAAVTHEAALNTP